MPILNWLLMVPDIMEHTEQTKAGNVLHSIDSNGNPTQQFTGSQRWFPAGTYVPGDKL